jgi:DNA-binding SARP family transcriptional activator
MGARVHLCGHLELEWDGERLERAITGRQIRLLFAFLTLHRERLVRRDELAEALWSEEGPPPQSDALLRPLLSRLRRALGADRLDGRAELALRFPPDTWIDREYVREAVGRGRAAIAAGDAPASWELAREALAIAERGLLPGLEAGWLEPFRTELEDQRVELLETAAAAGARLGEAELHEAERAARRAIEVAPFRESARVALVEVLRRRGNVAEALVAYDEFRVFLRDELGTAPGRELLSLHEALLRAEPQAPPPTAPAPAPQTTEQLPDRLAQAAAAQWVGRDTALARLHEEAARAAAGETALVLVVGDGGIGKTRLIAELAAGLHGFDVLYGRCDEEELFPYGPWVDLLRARLDGMDDAALAATLGSEAPELARLLPELRQRLPGTRDAPLAGDPETERRRLFEAVTRVVSRLAAQRPLLLVVDDMHWADRSSLLLGRHLAREPRLGPVLLLGAFRDTELGPGHPLPDLVADVERDRPVPRIRLAGMDEREVAALIGTWHGDEVAGDAVRAIRAETDGNPFFVKQLVRHLEEVGGGGRLALRDELGVPDGVRDVIARRIARLPEHAGHVLRVAALIGRDFEFDLLEGVADVPADALLDVLDAAVRGGLIAEVPSTPGRYSFAHALLRSTLEGEVSATRRALLHRRIGEAIEQRHRRRLDPWLDDLARHFAAAGPHEVDRAVDYAVRAAGQATARLAYDEAVRLLSRAAALRREEDPVDQVEVARLESALATAEAAAGRFETARASFARAAGAARAADAGPTFARAALGHSGGTWEQYGRDDPASISLLDEALRLLPAGDSPLRCQVLARRASLLYFSRTASWDDVVGTADEAVAIARRIGDDDALVAALAAAQYARWRPGRADDRMAVADELVERTSARGRLAAEAEARLWRAAALLERCRREEAEADIARFEQLAEQVPDQQLLILRDALRSMRAVLDGDYASGAAAADEVLAWQQRAEARGGTTLAVQIYGVAMLTLLAERGGFGGLAPQLEELVREIGSLPGWRATLAWAHLQAGRAELARAELEALSTDGFAVFPRDANLLPSLAVVAHALAELGDAGGLAALAEPLLRPLAGDWVIFGICSGTLGPAAYSLAVLQLLQDRADDAIGSFELALERSSLMRARPYVARSRAGLAAALRRRGGAGDAERAQQLAALAAADARELGMTRLQRELASS